MYFGDFVISTVSRDAAPRHHRGPCLAASEAFRTTRFLISHPVEHGELTRELIEGVPEELTEGAMRRLTHGMGRIKEVTRGIRRHLIPDTVPADL